MKGQCKDCEWWNKFKKEMPMGIGSCHRFAPVKSGIKVLVSDGWPETDYAEWCGEFQPKEVQE